MSARIGSVGQCWPRGNILHRLELEEIIHIGPETTVQMAWEKCLELRNDWKKHKQAVLDAGQVYLVGKLVNPFLGVANSAKLMTE
jgi:hypothetical protein